MVVSSVNRGIPNRVAGMAFAGLAVGLLWSCGGTGRESGIKPVENSVADLGVSEALALVEVDPSEENLESALGACESVTSPPSDCVEVARELEELHSDDEDPLKLTWYRSFRAQFLQAQGKNDEALALFEEIITLRESFFGLSDSTVAEGLNWLGNACLKGDPDPERAAEVFGRALQIWEETNGPESVAVAKISLNLAVAENALGHYGRALDLMKQSLEAMETTLGSNHPHVAIILDQLAAQETELGRFTDALTHSRRALNLAEKSDGHGTLRWAHVLHNRSWLLIRMGEFRLALPGLEQSLEVFRNEYGETDVRTVTVAENLAETQMKMGRLDQAAATIDEALQGARAGEDSGILALGLLIRAHVNLGDRDVDSAGRDFAEARRLLAVSTGERHPWCVPAIEGQARVALVQRDPEETLALTAESLSIIREVFGGRHPRMAESLVLRAEGCRRLGRIEEALEAAIKAEVVGREHLGMALSVVDERLGMTLAQNRVRGIDVALRMAESLKPAQVGKVWDEIIRSRAMVFDEMARRRRDLRIGASAEVAMLSLECDDARRNLAERVVYSLATDGEASRGEALGRAFERVEALERQLALVAGGTRVLRRSVGFEDVGSAMPKGTALVAFVRIDEGDLGSVAHEAANAYVVLSRRPDGAVSAIDLGSASRIDAAVQKWRDAFESRTLDPSADEARLRVQGEVLRRLVWDPVVAVIGGASSVILVPDGALHLINFSCLPSGPGRYLIEDGPTIRRVMAERDILPTSHAEKSTMGGALFACGGPDFGAGSARVSRRRENARDLVFGPLPGARVEVEDLDALWRKREGSAERRILLGKQATEDAFVEMIVGAGTIHVATHAFFLDAEARRKDRLREGLLFRSGLALAGATGAVGLNGGDGLLTAAEISSLDLEGAGWVTLSACGTGLGDVRLGEGVLGLERAFRVAGARTLIVSLWPVGDQETRTWMGLFYNYGFGGLSAAEAVRQASMDMLRERREAGRSTHPASWGAFVAVGW